MTDGIEKYHIFNFKFLQAYDLMSCFIKSLSCRIVVITKNDKIITWICFAELYDSFQICLVC